MNIAKTKKSGKIKVFSMKIFEKTKKFFSKFSTFFQKKKSIYLKNIKAIQENFWNITCKFINVAHINFVKLVTCTKFETYIQHPLTLQSEKNFAAVSVMPHQPYSDPPRYTLLGKHYGSCGHAGVEGGVHCVLLIM